MTKRVLGDGHGIRNLRLEAIQVGYGSSQLVALLPFEKEGGNFFTTALVRGRWDGFLLLFLVLVVNGTETVFGVEFLVLGFGMFSSDFPNALLLEWEISPAGAYCDSQDAIRKMRVD